MNGYARNASAPVACPQCAELRARLAQAEADALTFALRLYGEPETSLAPESQAAMQRWRSKCDALLRGDAV